ncbi:MAG: insulinase family protein [Deltaproteobacteria bacterium]|nr:MAG: insulinase family protein [Deltaproteobacteria bacterium]
MKRSNPFPRPLRACRPALAALALAALAIAASACGGSPTPPGTAAPAPAAAPLEQRLALPDIAEPMITAGTTVLEIEGLQVVHRRTPGNDVVAAGVFFTGGARHWRPETLGDERLALQVLAAAGPAHLTKDEFQAAIDARGATISAASGREFASVAAVSLIDDFDTIWALLVDALEAPDLHPDEIALQRARQLTRIRSELDDPDSAISILARRSFFAGRPAAWSPLGTLETVDALGARDLAVALDALLVRDRARLVLVGDLDPHHVQRAARALLDRGVLPARTPSEPAPLPPLPDRAPTVEVIPREGLPTAYVLGYFAAPAPDHPDHAALTVGVRLLSDRFFEEVRTRRNLSYAVSAGLGRIRENVGWLYVTSTRPEEALTVMIETVEALVAGAVSEQDVAEQVESALTALYMGLQANQAQASMLARWLAVTGDVRWADAHLERFRAVTPDEVRHAVDRWLRNVHLVVLAAPGAVDADAFPLR